MHEQQNGLQASLAFVDSSDRHYYRSYAPVSPKIEQFSLLNKKKIQATSKSTMFVEPVTRFMDNHWNKSAIRNKMNRLRHIQPLRASVYGRVTNPPHPFSHKGKCFTGVENQPPHKMAKLQLGNKKIVKRSILPSIQNKPLLSDKPFATNINKYSSHSEPYRNFGDCATSSMINPHFQTSTSKIANQQSVRLRKYSNVPTRYKSRDTAPTNESDVYFQYTKHESTDQWPEHQSEENTHHGIVPKKNEENVGLLQSKSPIGSSNCGITPTKAGEYSNQIDNCLDMHSISPLTSTTATPVKSNSFAPDDLFAVQTPTKAICESDLQHFHLASPISFFLSPNSTHSTSLPQSLPNSILNPCVLFSNSIKSNHPINSTCNLFNDQSNELSLSRSDEQHTLPSSTTMSKLHNVTDRPTSCKRPLSSLTGVAVPDSIELSTAKDTVWNRANCIKDVIPSIPKRQIDPFSVWPPSRNSATIFNKPHSSLPTLMIPSQKQPHLAIRRVIQISSENKWRRIALGTSRMHRLAVRSAQDFLQAHQPE